MSVGYCPDRTSDIYHSQFGSCGKDHVPCVHCNRHGLIGPDDGMIYNGFNRDFWFCCSIFPELPGQE